METMLTPEKTLDLIAGFFREKFQEHYQEKLKICLGFPEDGTGKTLFMLPLSVAENTSKTDVNRIRYTEILKSGEKVESEKNPILHFDLTLLIGFEIKPEMHNALALMRLFQVIKEYGQIKHEGAVVAMKILPDLALAEQTALWRSFTRPFRPSLTCKISVALQPIRHWVIRKVLERKVDMQFYQPAGEKK